MADQPVSDTWERGDPYEQYIGRWSRQVAPKFLAWLNLPPGQRWLDVGCGTGALCAAILDHCSPAQVAAVEPSDGFRRAAEVNLAGRAALYKGSATEIPLEPDSVDVVVSGLVLNFVPDQRAALDEMARVTSSGGTIGAYVWDYAGKMEIIHFFWNAVSELDPDAAPLDEGARFPICNPYALKQLFANTGLHKVEVTGIDVPTPFASFDDYWQPFLGGQGPAPAYVASLDEKSRQRLRERLCKSLPAQDDGSIHLVARAWAVMASVP
jgi:SAM-dependent methyltransferase